MSNNVPLLTVDRALGAAAVCHNLRGTPIHDALLAIVEGRAVVVPRMTEAEARKKFQAHWCPPDHDEAPEFHIHKQFAADAYLAALRDIGVVKP